MAGKVRAEWRSRHELGALMSRDGVLLESHSSACRKEALQRMWMERYLHAGSVADALVSVHSLAASSCAPSDACTTSATAILPMLPYCCCYCLKTSMSQSIGELAESTVLLSAGHNSPPQQFSRTLIGRL
eukprot:1159109-Pelagomonas_calceolata.AAC.11